MRSEPFESCTVQTFLMVRMGYADEKLGSFLKGFSVEVHGSELCDDIMYMRAGSDDSASFYDDRSYLAAALVRA